MEYSEITNDTCVELEGYLTALENEVEHFFTEPKFSEGVLGYDTFNCFYAAAETLEQATEGFDDVADSFQDISENYLLDIMNDETSNSIPHMENTDTTELNPLARIFRFKTKPRARNVKRGKPESYDHLKFFSQFGNLVLDARKGNIGRKKKHTSWSEPEVLKLVEGVSQCGVGKWTEIKKLFFSTCPNRSSVDLKDKWRNLLRASYKLSCVKGRDEWVPHTIPSHVLFRVRELSLTHPYPRNKNKQSKIKLSKTASFSSADNNFQL